MAGEQNTNNIKTQKESIILGSGKCYCMDATKSEYDLTKNGDLLLLCQALFAAANELAHIKGGATLNYSTTWYTAKDDLGNIQKTKMTEDTASLKLGIIATIKQEYLDKLFPTVERDAESFDDLIIDRVGGVDNDDGKTYYFGFINEDIDGDTVIIVKGKNGAALALQFQAGTESNIEPEVTAEPLDKKGRKYISISKTNGVAFSDISAPAEEVEPDGSDEPIDTIPPGEDEPNVANDIPDGETDPETDPLTDTESDPE